MAQLFSRAKPNKTDETIQRTKEKVIDLTKSLADRQRYLKALIGRIRNRYCHGSMTMEFYTKKHENFLFYLDQLSIEELQAFFKSSYQFIFYLFFENFSQVEINITRARM